MVKEVRWTPEALRTFNHVIEYLEIFWTEREIGNFIKATERVVEYISLYPRMFRKTDVKDVHEALVTPQNLLIYKVYDSHIDLITFWDTRQFPAKKKF